MSKVIIEISYDYKFVYFISSHSEEVNIGEQSHHNQKLSACSDMDFKSNLNFSTLNVRSRGGGSQTLDNVQSLSVLF